MIEIDHPATQRLKREILQRAGAPLPHLIPADLSHQRLFDVLQEDSYVRRERPTTLIVEGLTMYLTERAVHDSLITHSYLAIRN